MSQRFTITNAAFEVAKVNEIFQAREIDLRYAVRHGPGYVALDSATVKQAERGVWQGPLATGSSRECVAFMYHDAFFKLAYGAPTAPHVRRARGG